MESNISYQSGRADEIRDSDLYFDDGNVVLAASAGLWDESNLESPDVVTYFRVHRSILSKHSPVFRDMFTFQPPAEAEQYDGVPLVRLHDTVDDLRGFLMALYEPQYIPSERYHPDFASRMHGPLKLANKYQVECLRGQAVKQLRMDWPCNLDQCLRRRADIKARRAAGGPSAPDPIPVIKLVTNGGLWNDLQAESGFLFLSLLGGIRSPDGMVKDIARTLDANLLFRLFRGESRLSNFVKTNLTQLKSQISCNTAGCSSTYFWSSVYTHLGVRHWSGPVSLFTDLEDPNVIDGYQYICPSCTSQYQAAFRNLKKVVFDELPAVFAAD